MLGHLVSAFFAGFLSDAIGRKKSLLVDTAVFFLGFGLQATAVNSSALVLARLVLGYPLVSQVQSSPLSLVEVQRGSALIGREFHSAACTSNLVP